MRFPNVLAAVLALVVAAFAADDEFAGTWTVNVEKSRTGSRSPVATARMTIDAIADGYRITLSGGETLTLHLDEKDYPREPMGIAKIVGGRRGECASREPSHYRNDFQARRQGSRDGQTRGLGCRTRTDCDHRRSLTDRREAPHRGGVR